MAFLHPDLRWHISNMKWLRVCQSCIIPFASQCHGGLSERTGDERISFGAILSTGSFGRLDVSKPQICGVQLPYLCVLKEQVVIFIFLHQIAFFFFGFRRWSKPFWQQMLQWTSPEVTEQLLSFWLHRSGGRWAWWVWLIWWALRWVGGWESLGSHLRKSSFSMI